MPQTTTYNSRINPKLAPWSEPPHLACSVNFIQEARVQSVAVLAGNTAIDASTDTHAFYRYTGP